MELLYSRILEATEKNSKDMFKFLRDIISIPSLSGNEKRVINRIKMEMEKVGFDRVEIVEMGNVLGFIGKGKHVIAMDAHIDTVDIGEPSLWNYDPYIGYEDEKIILGRGASDQKGGMASMVYAGKVIKELNLEDDYTLVVVGSVQEEDCDGLCWQYLIKEHRLKPEFVVLTEPTSLNIYRGHRGRAEIKITTSGVSCHGSAPERGENAIYKMAPIISELKELNEKLTSDDFLGKGTLTVSEVYSSSPSRCAVADKCTISIDRRITVGEDENSIIKEINELEAVKEAGAKVEIYNYDKLSYTGFKYPAKCFFPCWSIEEGHEITRLVKDAYLGLFKEKPSIDKWTFSTNGTAIAGMFNIPCIGFGPGDEKEAHAPNEKTYKEHLIKAAAMYAVIPKLFIKKI